MSGVDHTKVIYFSGFSAYKNINVYSTTVPITNVSIPPGGIVYFERAITVEPGTKFAYVKMQANQWDFINPPTPLVWRFYPAACIVYRTLSVDPQGNGAFQLLPSIRISGNQVTFRYMAFNPNASAYAFNPIDIGVEYATFTID